MSSPILKTAETSDISAEALSAKPNLVGMRREEVKARITELGIEGFRANQLWQWIYAKGADDFSAMTNIKKEAQALLAQHFSIARAGVSRGATSFDATRKWLVKFADGNEVETVFIPDAPRGTLCVSSQVGCTLSCTFCHTGTQRLVRNLTPGEIITQVLMAKDGLGDWSQSSPDAHHQNEGVPSPKSEPRSGKGQARSVKGVANSPSARQLTNVVFMGMGEPLFNYENVVNACRIMLDGDGLKLSRRKITVSTSGVVPNIVPLAHEAGVNLAVSLHAVTNELRNEIVPINKKYPLEDLMEACRAYQRIVNDRHIMFEYVMLSGVNDSLADAKALVALLKGLRAKVNLIPFNPWPGAPYTCSSNNRIHAFGRVLIEAGIASPIRKTRGQDILAACGQLKSMSELKKGQKVKL